MSAITLRLDWLLSRGRRSVSVSAIFSSFRVGISQSAVPRARRYERRSSLGLRCRAFLVERHYSRPLSAPVPFRAALVCSSLSSSSFDHPPSKPRKTYNPCYSRSLTGRALGRRVCLSARVSQQRHRGSFCTSVCLLHIALNAARRYAPNASSSCSISSGSRSCSTRFDMAYERVTYLSKVGCCGRFQYPFAVEQPERKG